ncbi:hypothetical protein AAFC00_003989 [Neodothiora populina]|uniref:Thiamine phosphate synthase/TenI domain-containing protein n=1 Tax=Neodothiora populina TaxID=2781224 RepID=A0ABR3PII5_9PEZI
MAVDYSVYLVTDNTPAILGDKDIVEVVRAAVDGGVTIVQLRDKTSDTGELIKIAKQLHAVTKPKGVPLVINDRVDVALASGVEGVHIGQDDIDLTSARKILGKDAIIGVTANSLEEAEIAAAGGADYLGLGTVFATPTKENSKSIIGVSGVQTILSSLEKQYPDVKNVCIGGINASNCQRVLYQSTTPTGKRLDGIAVVSAIMAAQDPKKASSDLVRLVSTPPPFAASSSATQRRQMTQELIATTIPEITKRLAEKKPLCHNMTNLVVQNFAANVALAVGGSPIMSSNSHEAADLAALGGSLVLNMGSTTPEMRAHHLRAMAAYNSIGGPILLDPVGAGATCARREGVAALMRGGYFDVIKGNEGEIRTVSGAAGVKQHGVDSGASQLSLRERAQLVKQVAAREHNVVLMTGTTDVISDGVRTLAVSNGHALLGEITGSGCTLGTTIAAYLAVEREDKLLAVLAGVLHYEIAGERAAARKETVRGPGSFIPAFIDELYLIRQESVAGGEWAQGAKVEVLDI